MRWPLVVVLVAACSERPLPLDAPDLGICPPVAACDQDFATLSGSCFEAVSGTVALARDGNVYFCGGLAERLGASAPYNGRCEVRFPEVRVPGCRQTASERCEEIGRCVVWRFECSDDRCGFEIKVNFPLE